MCNTEGGDFWGGVILIYSIEFVDLKLMDMEG